MGFSKSLKYPVTEVTKDLVLVKYGNFLGKSFVVVVVFPRKNFEGRILEFFLVLFPKCSFSTQEWRGRKFSILQKDFVRSVYALEICLCIGLAMKAPKIETTRCVEGWGQILFLLFPF